MSFWLRGHKVKDGVAVVIIVDVAAVLAPVVALLPF